MSSFAGMQVAPELGPARTCIGYGRFDLLAYPSVEAMSAAWEANVRSLADDGALPAHTLLAATNHRPHPLRFVWHHILPRACSGDSVAANLVPLCDNCHYGVHVLLWELATGAPPSLPHAANQLRLAELGIYRAKLTGVPLSCIARESAL